MSLINGTRVIGSLTVGSSPGLATYAAGNGCVYVTNRGSGNVSRINGTVLDGWAMTGSSPYWAEYDPENGYVYVSNYGAATVSVLGGISVFGTVSVGGRPMGPAVDTADGLVYVPDGNGHVVNVINGTKLAGVVHVGDGPWFAAYDDGNANMYVGNYLDGNVSVIHGMTVVRSVAVGVYPAFATYDPGNGYVYVGNWLSDTVSVINGTKVIATLDVGTAPWAATYDPGDGDVYVLNQGSDNVSVINRTRVVATIDVGSTPASAVYDDRNGYLYVSNSGGSNVSVIPTGHTVTFAETGLPSGTNWSVRLDGARQTSTSADIVFAKPNGSYSYAIDPTGGYAARVAGGIVAVNGTDPTVPVAFALIDYLTSNISVSPRAVCVGDALDCPAHAGEARVTLSGSAPGDPTLAVAQGTARPLFEFVPYGNIAIVPGQRIVANCSRSGGGTFAYCANTVTARTVGGVTVLDGNWSNTVPFNTMYGGDRWTTSFLVRANGPPIGVVPVDACSTLTCRAADSGPVNGLYSEMAYVSPRSGTVLNASLPLATIRVEGLWATYPVAFIETSLPQGTPWSVRLNGTVQSSTTGAISFLERNGTYGYALGGVPGWSPSSAAGTVIVQGAPLRVGLNWTVTTYSVTFVPNGSLPESGWSVTFRNVLESGVGNFTYTGIPNGSYAFAIGTVAGCAVLHPSGTVVVAGANVTEAIAFVPAYTVSFLAHGLPMGTEWSVRLNGTTLDSMTPTITFTEPNGSYDFTIGSEASYTPDVTAGVVVVHGRADARTITFRSSSPPATSSGLPEIEGYASLAGVAAVIAAAVLVAFLPGRRPARRAPRRTGRGGPGSAH